MISDLVLEKELPEIIRNSAKAYAACIAGAIKEKEYIQLKVYGVKPLTNF